MNVQIRVGLCSSIGEIVQGSLTIKYCTAKQN